VVSIPKLYGIKPRADGTDNRRPKRKSHNEKKGTEKYECALHGKKATKKTL